MSETAIPHRDLELIAFRVGGQEFCVDVMSIHEIRGWTPATPIPHAPAYVRGVINLRGAVLPVIDLGARLGLGMGEPTARHVIVVTTIGVQTVGLLVEGVSDILTIADQAVQAPPDIGCETVKAFTRGILAVEGRMISLLVMDNILPEIEALAA